MQLLQIRACLALHRCRGLGDSARLRLLQYCPDPLQLFNLDAGQFSELGISAACVTELRALFNDESAVRLAESLQQAGVDILPISDERYPALLKEIVDPPPFLYIKGQWHALARPQLAIVGSRQTSAQGCENAFRFASALASAGLVVTSGLALGIDTAAHRGALAGGGLTVAVLGTGIDVLYPRQNRDLLESITSAGAVISELPPGSGPLRHHFPRRNRIISGMSVGVLVVEAALRSGSLITARCALEQGREVFAIPGSIHSPSSRGCHELIRQGAKLVDDASHILEEFGAWTSVAAVSEEGEQPEELNELEQTLLKAIGFDPVDIDTLQLRANLPVQQLASGLMMLEIKGLVENKAGQYQRIGR